MNISEQPNSSVIWDKIWEALKQKYANVSEVLSISESDVQRIHEYYKKTRKKDKETRTQMIIYDIVSQIRKENPFFPIELKKVYLISSAFSRVWLTRKKSPNQYRSTVTWKRKISPEEVMREIQNRQHLLLGKVREHGMSQWYAEFARVVNVELGKDKKDYELPLDWKWISKKLGSGDGKNLHSGWWFQALRLSASVRDELVRITTGRPIFMKRVQIRNNSVLRDFMKNFFYDWQKGGNKWWFHIALMQAIRTWNNSAPWLGRQLLPIHLYDSVRQQWLAGILWLKSWHTYVDFLVGMNLPISIWNSPNNTKRLYKKYHEYVLPLLQDILSPEILETDYLIEDNVLKMTQSWMSRWIIWLHIEKAQTIYENMVVQLY